MVTKNRAKWTMLRIYLIINFVLVLVLAGNASAATKTWDAGGGANHLWSLPANWDSTVPTRTDAAVIDNPPDANCLINATVDACCTTLDVGLNHETCYLYMTGGALTTSGTLSVGRNGAVGADACGVFTMTGGTIKTGTASMYIGYGTGGFLSEDRTTYGTFKMTTGCDVNVGGKLECGKNGTGVGKVYVNGGTLTIGYTAGAEDLEIGKYGTGTFYMTAGDVNVVDAIKLAEGGGTSTIYMDGGHIRCSDFRMPVSTPLGTPTVYLNSGDINCADEFSMANDNALMDITEGTLIIQNGSYVNGPLGSVYKLVSDGKIIGYGGDGYIIITPEGGGIGYSTVTAHLYDPNLAWQSRPRNYATVDWTPAGPVLSWTPGRYAAKHDVYFGTDKDDVNDANNPNTLPGRGRQDANNRPFPTPIPVLGETYYWRIDEVNNANIWKGIVWQFTMAGYEEVEDFDSYANDAALKTVWALTGSTTISLEDTIVHSSKGKSMKYEYTSGSATEASANTTGANKLPVDINDWTTADIKALTLYFYGDVTNSAEKMYVALKSTDNKSAVVYYDDPNDLKIPEWHEWNIKLSDFNDGGVNLHSIAKVYIGFGTRGGSPPASDGTVYFDDIRLYPRRCVTSRLPAGFGDVDGDCDVDFADVNIMVGDWLDTDANRKGSDGVLKGGASWVNDGDRGRCIQLDGVDDWVDLDDGDFSNFHNKTIAFWVKVKNYPTTPYPYLFYFSDGVQDNPYRIYIMTYTPGLFAVRARFVDTYSTDFTAGQDVWSFLAFVLKDAASNKCDGTFYCYNSATNTFNTSTTITGKPRHSGAATGVNLGSENDSGVNDANAVFDDFRVYDYALSAAEIWYLAHSGTGGGTPPDNTKMLLYYNFNEVSGLTAHNSSTYVYYHPLLSDAELYKGEAKGSRVVNLKDFAILANSWLEEQLWP